VYTVAPKAAAPAFSPKAGTYADAQSVSLTDKDAGAVIYYTKDGTTPPTSPTSSVYTGPITVSASETLNAVAIAPGHALSAVKAALYTIESSD